MAGLVPARDGLAGKGIDGRVLVVEVVFPWCGFLEEFAAAVAQEFVEADLDFEGWIAVVAVDLEV